MIIRTENAADHPGVHSVNCSAFETPAEADLVDALREQCQPVVSLVAADNERIVGHIMFSPVTLESFPELLVMGLAPMAVIQDRQRGGIGSALVRAGLEHCRRLGTDAVVVLGHPEFYPRFGFYPSIRLGITCEYDVPPEVFMVLELKSGILSGKAGTVMFHSAFRDLEDG